MKALRGMCRTTAASCERVAFDGAPDGLLDEVYSYVITLESWHLDVKLTCCRALLLFEKRSKSEQILSSDIDSEGSYELTRKPNPED